MWQAPGKGPTWLRPSIFILFADLNKLFLCFLMHEKLIILTQVITIFLCTKSCGVANLKCLYWKINSCTKKALFPEPVTYNILTLMRSVLGYRSSVVQIWQAISLLNITSRCVDLRLDFFCWWPIMTLSSSTALANDPCLETIVEQVLKKGELSFEGP